MKTAGKSAMRRISIRTFVLAAMAAVAIPAAAQEPTLKVNYNGTSPAETAAIKVLQEDLAKRGVKWRTLPSSNTTPAPTSPSST
jgi:hypothetical protein